MWRITLLGLTLGLAASLALPAHANFDAKMSVVCTELDDDKPDKPKLVRDKISNEDVVEACLEEEGLPTTPDNLAAHALVFDSDTPPNGELRVVRKCDAMVVCTLSTVGARSAAVKDTAKKQQSKSVVIFSLPELGAGNGGAMLCKQSQSFSPSSGKFSFRNSCTGILDVDGSPCTVKLTTGKLFQETGVCP